MTFTPELWRMTGWLEALLTLIAGVVSLTSLGLDRHFGVPWQHSTMAPVLPGQAMARLVEGGRPHWRCEIMSEWRCL